MIAFAVFLIRLVTVVLAGVPVATSIPAWIDGRGFVFAPLDPIVWRLAKSVRVDRHNGYVDVSRGELTVAERFGHDAIARPDGTIYVRLAPIVRGLGGSIRFDAVRKIVAIEMPAPGPPSTPTPFRPLNPTVAPATVFTPQPTVTARPTPSGTPQPRRTPVPVRAPFPSSS